MKVDEEVKVEKLERCWFIVTSIVIVMATNFSGAQNLNIFYSRNDLR